MMKVIDEINNLVDGEEEIISICGITTKEEDENFSIKDENGKKLVEFPKGGIRTSKFDSRAFIFSAKVENGGLNTDGSYSNSKRIYESTIRSSFLINTGKASGIRFFEDGFTLYQYGENYQVIDIRMAGKGTASLLDDCKYIKFTTNKQRAVTNITFEFIDISYTPTEEKNVQIANTSEKILYDIEQGVYTTCRLMLPPNYTNKGNKVPVVVWDAGDGSFIRWDDEIYASGSIGPNTNLNYLRDSGIAVLAIYGWGNVYNSKYPICGMGTAIAIPTNILAHEKGIKFVTDRFNLDSDNVFQIGKSGGGKICLYNVINSSPSNYRHVYAFSVVFDGLCFPQWGAGFSDFRKAINDDMNFDGDTSLFLSEEAWSIESEEGQNFIKQNASKFTCAAVNWQGMVGKTAEQKVNESNEFQKMWWANKMSESVYNRFNLSIIAKGAPLTVIAAPDDASCPYQAMKEVVIQLQNGGHEAKLITLESGGHTAADFGNEISDVTTRLGIHYDKIAYGWHYVVEDIYKRYLKTNND